MTVINPLAVQMTDELCLLCVYMSNFLPAFGMHWFYMNSRISLDHNSYMMSSSCLLVFLPCFYLFHSFSYQFLLVVMFPPHFLSPSLLCVVHLFSTRPVWEPSTWPLTDRTRTDAPFPTTNWTPLAGPTPPPDHSPQSTRDQIHTSPPQYCLNPDLTPNDKIQVSAHRSSVRAQRSKAPTGRLPVEVHSSPPTQTSSPETSKPGLINQAPQQRTAHRRSTFSSHQQLSNKRKSPSPLQRKSAPLPVPLPPWWFKPRIHNAQQLKHLGSTSILFYFIPFFSST